MAANVGAAVGGVITARHIAPNVAELPELLRQGTTHV
jgi:hypothetical protein